MTLKKLNLSSEKGFTLVELMIVVAIIGILAAVAIPNFIAYRNKAFCSTAESDAMAISGSIADYFAIPAHVAIATADVGFAPGANSFTIAATAVNTAITITVTDASARCPADYQAAQNAANNATAYWDGAGNFVKVARN